MTCSNSRIFNPIHCRLVGGKEDRNASRERERRREWKRKRGRDIARVRGWDRDCIRDTKRLWDYGKV